MTQHDIGHEWDGDPTTWPRHKLRLTKFKRAHAKKFCDFPWFFTATNPKERDQWDADFTVPEPDSEDDDDEPNDNGSGAEPGTKLKKETAVTYRKAGRLYKQANA